MDSLENFIIDALQQFSSNSHAMDRSNSEELLPLLHSAELASRLDHTLLRPDAVAEEIKAFTRKGLNLGVASVCTQPGWVPVVRKILQGSRVKVCTVIGFPHGANTPRAKAFETRDAILEGADEIDLVLNIGQLKSGNIHAVFDEIAEVKEATQGRLLKVILETALLTREEIISGSLIASLARADFVKTSTGFSNSGATLENVELMKKVVRARGTRVKASGGIRDRKTALLYLTSGADRIGTSSTESILTEDA